jgi:aryl-alcohol dehydrogenase-like predicted oxidoreductase
VRTLGLSEAAPQTIRRARKVHPIAVLQTKYSPWSREPEDQLLGLRAELEITFLAHSSLGRGFLPGQIKRFGDLAPDDFRSMSPRFQGDNFQKNLQLVDRIAQIASKNGCIPPQLALAWVIERGPPIVTIPGAKRINYLEENVNADKVRLTPEELKGRDEIAPRGVAAGARYPAL